MFPWFAQAADESVGACAGLTAADCVASDHAAGSRRDSSAASARWTAPT